MSIGSRLRSGMLLILAPVACVIVAGFFFLLNRDTMIIAFGPSWRGIIPGRTSQQEVISIMGQPDEIVKCEIRSDGNFFDKVVDVLTCFSAPLTYKYREAPISDAPAVTHEIRFKANKVWVVVEDARLSADSEGQLTLRQDVEQFGWPDQVTYSRKSPYDSAILFCEHGIMLIADENKTEWIYYFVPMPIERCLTTFKNEISVNNPYQNTDVILGSPNKWPWLKTKQ